MKRKNRKLVLQKETIRSQMKHASGANSFLECVTVITYCTCGYSCGHTCLGTCEDCPSWFGSCNCSIPATCAAPCEQSFGVECF